MPNILVSTLYGAHEKKPLIDIRIQDIKDPGHFQISVYEARDLAVNLLSAAESAIQDAFIVEFVQKLSSGDQRLAAGVLADFRQWRSEKAL